MAGSVVFTHWPSLIAGLDYGLDRWTGLLDRIIGSNQSSVKAMMHSVANGTASKVKV